jgi:hypothetical protein
MAHIARYWRSQTVFLTVLFAALLMRGLIPPGYMPAPGQGLFALELCTAEQYQMPAGQKTSSGAESRPPGHHHPAPSATTKPQPRGHALFGQSPLVDARAGAHTQPADASFGQTPSTDAQVGEHDHADASSGKLPWVAGGHQHQHNGATPAGHDSPCPFAATAVCATAPVVLAHVAVTEASMARASHVPQIHAPSIVARSQSARAPPSLS